MWMTSDLFGAHGVLLSFYFLRLPLQTVSYEQILGTETVLEGGKTWRQQHHGRSPPQQTSRMCGRSPKNIGRIIQGLLGASLCVACCWPGEEAEWVWKPEAAGNHHPIWKCHPGVSTMNFCSTESCLGCILQLALYVLGSSSNTIYLFVGLKWS